LRIVAQLPHIWRIFVASVLTALNMVNHCSGGFGSYAAILRPEQFRHSRRAFAQRLALSPLGGETISSNGTIYRIGVGSPFGDQSDAAKALAAAFLDEYCAGANGLSEDDNAKLEEIRDGAAPVLLPMPKP
jgi:hypothetical protein